MLNYTNSILILCGLSFAQEPVLNSWILNEGGEKASYWKNTTEGPGKPNFVLESMDDNADIERVCFTDDFVYVEAQGLTALMGQFINPSEPSAQNNTWKLSRNPIEAANKTQPSYVGAIGVLTNGVAIFGSGDARSWSNANNQNENGGDGIWNQDAWFSEGHTLDTAFAAHPQAQGIYHTHATPFRLYKNDVGHSSIIGFANDGVPIYGPFSYEDPLDTTSAIVRMETSYDYRDISTRETLKDETVLNDSQKGPDVSTTYPLGMYNEDYEYVDGLGHLDEHNGRFAKTPDYPNGTYAYFVTTDINGEPLYPYYVGDTYYATESAENIRKGSNATTPISASCDADEVTEATRYKNKPLGSLKINQYDRNIEFQFENTIQKAVLSLYDSKGRVVKYLISNQEEIINLSTENLTSGIYLIQIDLDGKSISKRLNIK
jgi:hypothetical protein